MGTQSNRNVHVQGEARREALHARVRTGDLLLCSGRSAMSRMIQRATESPWSHVALLVRLETIDRIVVFESVESVGVRAVGLSMYLGDGISGRLGYDGELMIARHAELESLDSVRVRAMVSRGVDLLGRTYDRHEIVRIAARIAAGKVRESCENTIEPDDAYICSEFVWECYRAAGVTVKEDRRGFISPNDFAVEPHVRALWKSDRRRSTGSS